MPRPSHDFFARPIDPIRSDPFRFRCRVGYSLPVPACGSGFRVPVRRIVRVLLLVLLHEDHIPLCR
jgi:hypothetical protein